MYSSKLYQDALTSLAFLRIIDRTMTYPYKILRRVIILLVELMRRSGLCFRSTDFIDIKFYYQIYSIYRYTYSYYELSQRGQCVICNQVERFLSFIRLFVN